MPNRRQLLMGITGLAGCVRLERPAAPPASRPRDAFEVARDIVANRLPDLTSRAWVLFHVSGALGTGVAYACRVVYGVGYFLDAAGIDPDDLERVLTFSSNAVSYEGTLEAVHVYEHRLPPERAREAFEAVVAESPGAERIEGLGFPAADVTIGTAPRLIAAPEPHLLVTLPAGEVVGAIQFVGSAGLPVRAGNEVLVAGVIHPGSDVLGIESPPTVTAADASAFLNGAGDARVTFSAASTDPHQAELDARWISERVNEALTIDMKIAKLRVLGPYVFRASGNHVVSELTLSRAEAEWVVGMARTLMPGG